MKILVKLLKQSSCDGNKCSPTLYSFFFSGQTVAAIVSPPLLSFVNDAY